jgi:hypothetical protein
MMMVSQKNSSKSAGSRPVWMPALFITKILSWMSQRVCTIIWQKRNKGCCHTIVFTYGIDSVSKFPRIAAYASNHVVPITEVTTDQDKIHPSRNGTAAQFLGHCVQVDKMLLVDEAEARLVC